MQLIPISYEDLTEITQVAQTSLVHDRITSSVVAEKIFDEPHYRPQHALKAVVDGRIVAFMVGHVGEHDGLRTGWIKFFATRPDYRRRGAAKALLTLLEQRFQNEGARQVRTLDSVPNYLSAGIDPRYTEAVVMFERSGYRKQSENIDMICSLDRDLSTDRQEERLQASGIAVQRMRKEDASSLFDLLNRHWPSWRRECLKAMENEPCSVHIALDGGKVIAFAVHEANNKGTGWFGPMGTDPAYRGRKIGEVLLKRSLVDLKNLGYEEVIIPWVGPIYFYLNSVGARVHRVLWVYVKDL